MNRIIMNRVHYESSFLTVVLGILISYFFLEVVGL